MRKFAPFVLAIVAIAAVLVAKLARNPNDGRLRDGRFGHGGFAVIALSLAIVAAATAIPTAAIPAVAALATATHAASALVLTITAIALTTATIALTTTAVATAAGFIGQVNMLHGLKKASESTKSERRNAPKAP